MANWKLYNVAKCYIAVIEQMERTKDRFRLIELEEQRIIWHNRLLQVMKREGIAFRDREHVTQLAYHIVRGSE